MGPLLSFPSLSSLSLFPLSSSLASPTLTLTLTPTSMMQDYPKVLPSSSPVGFTTAPSWLCYSPCKNNAKDAAESAAQGVPASAAWTAESDQYFCKAEMLRLLGVHAPPGPEIKFQGIAACSGPRVVIDPSTAIFFSDIKQVFPTPSQVTISARSTRAITGNVVIESLWLDGRLRIEAEKGKKIIVRAGRATERRIVNAGDELVDLDLIGPSSRAGFFAGYSEVDRMRGFVVRVADELLISTNAAAGGIKPEAGTEGAESGDGEGVVFIFTGRALVPLAAYDSCDLLGDDVKACLNI